MPNSEMLQTFNENREAFKAYGFTCELWKPNLMKKPDRHNEIEINFFTEGSMTYLFHNRKITVPAKRLTVFWGLVPHQIIHYEGASPYFVCTIPFSQFLEWKLPATFVNRILKGEVLYEASSKYSQYDEFLFAHWIEDMVRTDFAEVALHEMRARLSRLAIAIEIGVVNHKATLALKEIRPVDSIAIYIAQNYRNRLKVSDIGKAVGLHPDYANALFKKAFSCTLSEYITEDRISHAQRKLITSDMNITEIAFDCGFNSMSSFNTAFLKINGCTPREFRKRAVVNYKPSSHNMII